MMNNADMNMGVQIMFVSRSKFSRAVLRINLDLFMIYLFIYLFIYAFWPVSVQ